MGEAENDALRRLHDSVMRLHALDGLEETLQGVLEAVCELVGFEVASICLLEGDTLHTAAVVGDPSAVSELLGSSFSRACLEADLANGRRWGSVVFTPHDAGVPDGLVYWVSDEAPPADDPGAWHPMDALSAPLYTSSRELLGILAVDLPRSRRRPDEGVYRLLEMFAAHAAIAVRSATAAEQTRRSEQMLRLAFDSAGTGMGMVSLRGRDAGRFVRVNRELCRILGFDEHDLLARTVQDLVHPADYERDRGRIEQIARGERHHLHVERRFLHAQGHHVWVEAHARVLTGTPQQPRFAVLTLQDISRRRHEAADLRRRATLDPLTGLPHRQVLAERLEQAQAAVQRTGHEGTLLFCDLDDFKSVNDRHGHTVGDEVLVLVAQRLAGMVRTDDTVVRYGGDELVVVADGLDASERESLARRIEEVLGRPMRVGPVQVSVGVSVGLGVIRSDDDVDTAVARADRAMYAAKAARRRGRIPASVDR